MTDVMFLARVIARAFSADNEEAEEILRFASQADNEPTERGERISSKDVDECYALYPTHDVNNSNRCTGKCSKDKNKLRAFIGQCGKEHVMAYIKAYVDECAREGRWLLNFGTFLNQRPEVSKTETEDGLYK